MLYRPERGRIWDPSVIWHEGVYYMFSMHMDDGCPEWNGMWLATSSDGVHWEGRGRVLEGKTPIWKMFIFKSGKKFIMNYGSLSGKEGHGNDTLRFFESIDLINWKHICENNPDPRWYNEKERWDHMYVIPKDNEDPKKGYWGYVVATPVGDSTGAWGMQQSADGVQWEVIRPPEIEWGNTQRSREFEGGGCERIGDRYYFIGGCCPPYAGNYGYSVYTFTGENPIGPFKPDVDAFRLCGFSGMPGKMFVQGLAAWCRVQDELLISNYMICANQGEHPDYVWFLPLRKAVVDEDGHLHLGYWEKNEAMKGACLDIDFSKYKLLSDDEKASECEKGVQVQEWEKSVFNAFHNSLEMQTAGLSKGYQLEDRHMIVLIDAVFDLEKGIVFEGTLNACENPKRDEVRARCWRPALAGFYIEEKPGEGTSVLLEVGHPKSRHTYICAVRSGDGIEFDTLDTTGFGCATVAGVDRGKKHTFRLFLRGRMFELYIDNLLVQTFTTQNMPTGRLGFIIQNAGCTYENLKIWSMEID